MSVDPGPADRPLRRAKPRVISEVMGHSSVAFTTDVYSHIIDGIQNDVMALLDEVLPAGVNNNYLSLNRRHFSSV